MEQQKVTLKDIILILISQIEPEIPTPNTFNIYYVDENAVWVVEHIVNDKESSSGYAFLCHVDSVFGNGIDKYGERYKYKTTDHFIFDKDDEFFLNIEDAYVKRAEILEDIISKSEWIKKDEI